MTAQLDVKNYDHYYMWDAQEQYWKGHEWWSANKDQPVLDGHGNGNYPKNNSDSRWYNEGSGSPFDATQSCATLPNVNEMTWYAKEGDPRWDANELWTTMGHLYKGGMWFKKKAYISGYNSNTAVDGTDWRTNGNTSSWPAPPSLPSAADAGKYFYLPALGFYLFGQLYSVGGSGWYWSSSVYSSSTGAYSLGFSIGTVGVDHLNYRSYGYRVGGFK